MTELDKVVKAD